MKTSKSGDILAGALATLAVVVGIALIVGLLLGGLTGIKAWSRSQKRADANNRVKVTTINIRTAQQQARVIAAQDATVQAQADQRFIAATGIRKAQDEISKTLNPLYVQWEAIQAQMKMANSPSHSQVYIPVGANGVPLVQTVGSTVGTDK
ncbi:hypothetical protein [Candidatus Solirubrobacter pratensis]|uniref:hypothetical protein n=1 Tax=Candidatus Solirubrobacter pratensis TaxID=1298857 RepID=UPI00068550F5|nr:hypothetical protein [Candidatus Solirubrobacter pratensis]